MDISKQLLEYSVEYNVLQEELSTPRPETKKLKQMEDLNRVLKENNKSLTEQLEVSIFLNSCFKIVTHDEIRNLGCSLQVSCEFHLYGLSSLSVIKSENPKSGFAYTASSPLYTAINE